MITYKKLRPTSKPLWDLFIIWINRYTLAMAKKNARELSKSEGRPYSILDQSDLFILLNSSEKDDINRKMPKGAEMGINEFYKHRIYATDRFGNGIKIKEKQRT